MDADQVAFFKDRYSRLSDEELANLLIGRHERFSEEANAALTAVLEQKNSEVFTREVQAKVDDLNAQARAATLAVEKQREHNKRARRAMLVFIVVAATIFALVAFMR